MKLLTDRTMEIPPFLLRNPDGSFAYPDCAFSITAAVIAAVDTYAAELNEKIQEANRRDAAVRDKIEIAALTTSRADTSERAQERKARKQAERERLTANKLKQREVFIKHFKWDHEQ